MAATVQLSGIDQGFLAKLMGAGGRNNPVSGDEASPEAVQEQLRQFLDELRNSPDKASPELQALLAQLLNGGNALPDMPDQAAGDGRALPPFAALAQALSGQVAGNGETVRLPGQAAPGADSTATPDSLEAFEQLLQDSKGKLDGVLSGAVRKDFEALLNQLGDRSLAAAQAAQPANAGAFGVAAPAGMQGGPQLSQNLLSMPVPQAVSDPAWGAALGERLIWMAKGDHQMAELKISPPNLGPLEVRLNINHDQASVSFVSHHAAVRDAIESAIPRLREMLAEQSINLVQADVGSGRQQDPGGTGGGAQGMAAAPLGDGDPELGLGAPLDDPGATVTQRGLGLLDLFA